MNNAVLFPDGLPHSFSFRTSGPQEPGSMNGDAIRRTADRLIDQLTHIQRTHGELSGVIVHEEPNSSWCDPPILHRGHFVFDGPVTCHIWTETNLPADEQNQFERLCPSLGDLAFQLQDNAPPSLRGWIQTRDPSVLRCGSGFLAALL